MKFFLMAFRAGVGAQEVFSWSSGVSPDAIDIF